MMRDSGLAPALALELVSSVGAEVTSVQPFQLSFSTAFRHTVEGHKGSHG